MKAKYIVFETTFRKMVIFHEAIVHADMASMCSSLGTPISAGFVQVNQTYSGCEVICYGESVSLNLKPDVEADQKLAAAMLDCD